LNHPDGKKVKDQKKTPICLCLPQVESPKNDVRKGKWSSSGEKRKKEKENMPAPK
jgi:hypothetical protein